MNPFSEDESISVRQVVVVFGVSHSHRGFSPVVSLVLDMKKQFQRFSFVVFRKAVETDAWVAPGLPTTGLKPRCE